MKRVSTFLVTLAFLVFAGTATAQAQSEVMASVGRGVEDADIDVVRLAYRRMLPTDERWWVPTLVEFGGGIWRVPDLAGTTQRFDLHGPIWVFAGQSGARQPALYGRALKMSEDLWNYFSEASPSEHMAD